MYWYLLQHVYRPTGGPQKSGGVFLWCYCVMHFVLFVINFCRVLRKCIQDNLNHLTANIIIILMIVIIMSTFVKRSQIGYIVALA